MENKDNKPSPKSQKTEEADKDKLPDSLNQVKIFTIRDIRKGHQSC
jgi:hypothetical protein